MGLLGLKQPKCPRCGSRHARIDWFWLSNAVRIPVGLAAALILGRSIFHFRFKCKPCGEGFLASPNGD